MLNVALLKKIWLKRDEVPVLVIRRSALNWFWQFFLVGALLCCAFFLMPYLWLYGWIGICAFAMAVAAALFILFRSLYERYFTCWILTNLRLIDIYQHGFLRREISEAIYDRLEDVSAAKSGLLDSIFNLGDISVALFDSRVKLLLRGVYGHERAVSEILLQQENYQKTRSDIKDRQARRMLQKIKNKIGAAAFERLLGD